MLELFFNDQDICGAGTGFCLLFAAPFVLERGAIFFAQFVAVLIVGYTTPP
jgi:hypothetical protein